MLFKFIIKMLKYTNFLHVKQLKELISLHSSHFILFLQTVCSK
jgi:hypothetical protein